MTHDGPHVTQRIISLPLWTVQISYNLTFFFSKETKHSASLASMNFPTPYLQTHLFGLGTYHLNTCNIEPFSNLSQACKLIGGLMKESQTDPSGAQQNHPHIDQLNNNATSKKFSNRPVCLILF